MSSRNTGNSDQEPKPYWAPVVGWEKRWVQPKPTDPSIIATLGSRPGNISKPPPNNYMVKRWVQAPEKKTPSLVDPEPELEASTDLTAEQGNTETQEDQKDMKVVENSEQPAEQQAEPQQETKPQDAHSADSAKAQNRSPKHTAVAAEASAAPGAASMDVDMQQQAPRARTPSPQRQPPRSPARSPLSAGISAPPQP